jgi:bacterioferritin
MNREAKMAAAKSMRRKPPAVPPEHVRAKPHGAKSAAAKAADAPFLTDVSTLRERARQHIMQGAVTPGYKADRDVVVRILNEALATEIVCVLRYKRHYFMASGINAGSVAAEFLQHANEEQAHADEIAQRIVQLGGEPNLSPEGLLLRSHSEYVEGKDLVGMIREDLVAERVAIDSYSEMIRYLGHDDPTTTRMLEGILAMEEEHANDLVGLLEELGTKGSASTQPRARSKRR